MQEIIHFNLHIRLRHNIFTTKEVFIDTCEQKCRKQVHQEKLVFGWPEGTSPRDAAVTPLLFPLICPRDRNLHFLL